MSERELTVSGDGNIPGPWNQFSACNFGPGVTGALAGLGFAAPTPIQAYCWPAVAAGRDVVGVAETGSGKTLTFLAPAFDSFLSCRRASRYPWPETPAVLVMAPTRELALQIEKESQRLGETLGIRSTCLYGGVDFRQQFAVLKNCPEVVVACPGRLLDLIHRKKIYLDYVAFLALDEADRMLDMGFEDQVRSIIGTIPKKRQTVMFTATWPLQIQALAKDYARDPVLVQQGDPGRLACNVRITQELHLCDNQIAKLSTLVKFLKDLDAAEKRTIVFVNTKAAISGIAQDLQRAGLHCVALHGDLDQQERERSLEDFRKGKCDLILATDVAARGLDIRDVRAVVCFDAAMDKETHVHRIGRTGRAGKDGRALTLISKGMRYELQMAQEIFSFMKEAGQTVSAKLEAEVHGLLHQKKDRKKEGNDDKITLSDSSDDEIDARPCKTKDEDWKPWYRRPCPVFASQRSDMSSLATTVAAASAASHEENTGANASDLGSLLGGTTYLENPVEHVFGNAGAKDISNKLSCDTVRHGCRLVTHDTEGPKKPFRWMAMRRVHWSDIAAASSGQVVANAEPDQDYVWHVVIHELTRTKAGVVVVAANHFKSNISLVYEYLSDAFQLLEEDDPQIIEVAMANKSIVALLQMYFETGDTTNPVHYHTMAKINLWPAGTLLHHCCESGFVRCVEYLMAHHTPQAAPADQPWLQLADPCWLDKTWRNSAFHSTAWTGQAEVMSVLAKWARDHNQGGKIRYLFDKKKQTPLDLVDARLKKAKQRGLDADNFKLTYNALCPLFNQKLLPGVDRLATSNQSSMAQSIVLMDAGDNRRALKVSAETLNMQSVTAILEAAKDELCSGRVDTVLLSRIELQAAPSAADEESSMDTFLQLVRLCRRVAFVNCFVLPSTAICMCRALSRLLRKLDGSSECSLRSLVFPSWLEVPAGGSQDFAEALWDLSVALRETCCLHGIHVINLAAGTTTGYLPETQRHIPQVLSATMYVKSVAWGLLGNGPDDWKDSDVWSRMKASNDKFASQNPLMRGAAALERKMLNRGALTTAEDVPSCLSPGWRQYVEVLVDSLVSSTLTLPKWAPIVARRQVAETEEALNIVRRMADEALLFLLQMRRRPARPGGLPNLGELMYPLAQESKELERCFPKAVAYFRRNFGSWIQTV